MSNQSKKNNPKADKRALLRWQQAKRGTVVTNIVIDTNKDRWIGLPSETTLAGTIHIYRYFSEIVDQPIAGVLIDMNTVYDYYKFGAQTLVIELLDKFGVEYRIPISEVYKKGIHVTLEDRPGQNWLVLVLLEHLNEFQPQTWGRNDEQQ